MTNNVQDSISKEIWLVKGLAIFTVFFAHMPISESNHSVFILQRLFSIIGMVGVPAFMFLSGYLFKKGNIKKRMAGLLIPLLIWGSITFLLHIIPMKCHCSLWDYFYWLIGSNCYLYFVTVLFEIILLYNLCGNPFLWAIIGILSIWASQQGLIGYTLHYTPYMNPLNFILYFSLGVIVRKTKYYDQLKNPIIVFTGLIVVLVPFFNYNHYTSVWYFDLTSMIVCLGATILIINIAPFLKTKPLTRVGMFSYVIYLSHMQIATTLNKILQVALPGYLEVVKVLIAFIIAVAFVKMIYYFLNKRHALNIMRFLGYRQVLSQKIS